MFDTANVPNDLKPYLTPFNGINESKIKTRKQASRQAGKQARDQANKQTNKQTDKQTNKQTNKQNIPKKQ